ncbi:uncharacterized protein LOC143290590 isoform X2 [Babylonia areolata]
MEGVGGGGGGSSGAEDPSLQQAAEEGFATNLQRQLVRARAQLQAVEKKYQEKVQENDSSLSALKQQLKEAQDQMALLIEEKTTLQQKYQDEKQEKEAALQTVNDLQEKCQCLQLEKEKIMKEEAILHSSLRKAHQEIAVLRERPGDLVESELTAEVAHMRSVIKNLKGMMEEQKERLGNCSKVLANPSGHRSLQPVMMSRSLYDPGSMASEVTTPMASGRGGGSGGGGGASSSSHSGQSWEMVNAASLSARQQQEQQQQQQLRAMQQRCVTTSSAMNWAPQGKGAVTKPLTGKGGMVDAGRVVVTASNGVVGTGGHNAAWGGSHSAIVQRKPPSHNIALPPKSRTEVLKPPHIIKPHDFVDGSSGGYRDPSHHLLVGDREMSQTPAPRQTLPQETAIRLNNLGMVTENPANAAVYSPPPQPVFQQTSKLNNLDAYKGGSSVPSMHILNQGVMAGARVIRNTSDSFGSSGGTTLLGSPLMPGLAAGSDHLTRHIPGHWPQDHANSTPINNMSELSPLEETQPVMNHADSGLDRRCPVCAKDFSHISMDEFQCHVFECFESVDESSSAPETLQPVKSPKPGVIGGTELVCPMCERRFPESSTSQQFFEGHVQSHFEEVADQFEVLDLKEP